MPHSTEVSPEKSVFALYLLLMLGAASATATTVAPLPGSSDYIAQGVLVGAKSGTYRAAGTTRFKGEPTAATRPLSVHPQSTLNGELSGNHSPRLGPRALPPVFGGFTAIVYAMKEPAPFTTRTQFHDSPSKRDDFVNLNVYVESNQPQPAGLEFSFTGALVFLAGEAGEARIVPLESVSHVSFFATTQRSYARLCRVLVRDADSGDFFVSEHSSSDNRASIALAGSKWAKINPADLTVMDEYRPAAFQRLDHIGVYATIPVTEIGETLTAFGVICNVALHSFEYTLAR